MLWKECLAHICNTFFKIIIIYLEKYCSKWFLSSIGPEGLSRLLDGFEDKSAYAQTIFGYMAPELTEPILFIGRTNVHINLYIN